MSYELIIFDCDGTLVNSEVLNIEAIIALARDFGVNDFDVEYGLSHFSGYQFANILEIITEQTGVIFPENIAKLYIEKINTIASNFNEKLNHYQPEAGRFGQTLEAGSVWL